MSGWAGRGAVAAGAVAVMSGTAGVALPLADGAGAQVLASNNTVGDLMAVGYGLEHPQLRPLHAVHHARAHRGRRDRARGQHLLVRR